MTHASNSLATDLDVHTLGPDTIRAAQTTIEHTARRLNASPADLQQVLATLFSATVSTPEPDGTARPPAVDAKRRGPLSVEMLHRIRRLRADGYTQREIASQIGLSRSTIANLLTRGARQ